MKPEIHVDLCSLCRCLMSLGFAAWGSHADVSGMSNSLRSCGSCWPFQLLRAMSGSVVLIGTRTVLMSVDPVTAEAHADAHGLGCCLKPC